MDPHTDESLVYYRAKEFLITLGWLPIAGEPAGGSDHLPRIEIRDPAHTGKGSKGAYKIDLISVKESKLLLTELKVSFSESDVRKLNEITSARREHLRGALKERLQMELDEFSIIKSIGAIYLESTQLPEDFVGFNLSLPNTVLHESLLED